jgi:hypothetical protein
MVTWFRRGDFPEPGPRQIAALGIAPGYTIVEHDDPAELDAAGRAANVSAADQWNGHRIASFVDQKTKTVHLQSLKALGGDQDLYDANRAHEGCHTWDIEHDETGRNWYWPTPDGKLIPVSTLADLTAAKARYPQPVSFDWSKALPTTPDLSPDRLKQPLPTAVPASLMTQAQPAVSPYPTQLPTPGSPVR